MLGREAVTGIVRGELFAGVEDHLQRRKVRLQNYVRSDDLTLQLRMCSDKARVLMVAHVVPGPAVEAILLHAGDVVGDEVVAQTVTLVGGAPELTSSWVDRLADAVPNAIGVHLEELTVRSELKHVSAMKL